MKEKTILIIDDAKFTRTMFEDILTQNGYECITAENAEIGLDKYKKDKPNLILMDIIMPGKIPDIEGIIYTRNIKLLNRNVSIIIVTAIATPINILLSLGAGAEHIITKPIEISMFLKIINDIFLFPRKYFLEDIKEGLVKFEQEHILTQSEINNILDKSAFKLSCQIEISGQINLPLF